MGILKNLLVTGAARFVNTIKGSITHAQNGMYYGTCSTAAGTAAKVVNLVDPTGFELKPGVMIAVKFTTSNTASNVTINVEGTGAKQIWSDASVNTGNNTGVTGYANRYIYYVYDGTHWVFINQSQNVWSNAAYYSSAQCETGGATAAKVASCTNYALTANTYLHFNIRYANTAASAITMNVNSKGAKPIYINGAASSSSNHTLPAGTYIAFYNGTYWNFRTDGLLPASISGTVNGHTLYADVPENAAFTDTTDLGSMTGTLGVNQGGTGATSASLARTNLGLGTAAILGYETTVASDSNLPTGNAVMNLKSSLTVDGVKFNSGTSIIHYCESSTAAGTAAKTASCSNFIKADGAVVYVKFAYANTASSPTLNISGTGAANIRYRNANITSSYLAANEVYCFVYYGGYYHMVGDVATSATTAQIQSAVDSWLDEHVSDNTIVYESSLTHTVITSTTDITW